METSDYIVDTVTNPSFPCLSSPNHHSFFLHQVLGSHETYRIKSTEDLVVIHNRRLQVWLVVYLSKPLLLFSLTLLPLIPAMEHDWVSDDPAITSIPDFKIWCRVLVVCLQGLLLFLLHQILNLHHDWQKSYYPCSHTSYAKKHLLHPTLYLDKLLLELQHVLGLFLNKLSLSLYDLLLIKKMFLLTLNL